MKNSSSHDEKSHLFGVCKSFNNEYIGDGHGNNGKNISGYLEEHLPGILKIYLNKAGSNPSDALTSTF